MNRRNLLLGAFAPFLCVSCDDSSKISSEIGKRLPGVWLEERQEGELYARGIVTLEPSGTFHEIEKRTMGGMAGTVESATHAGEWAFDGTNFKRKYMRLNGKPLSNANFTYVTYAVKAFQQDKFVGVDNIRSTEARFTRTEAKLP